MPLSDFTAALACEGFGKTTIAEGYTMQSYDMVLYRELRADGFAAIAALFYARKAKRGY